MSEKSRKEKRTYTFRQGEMTPYQSGSFVHEQRKSMTEADRKQWGPGNTYEDIRRHERKKR